MEVQKNCETIIKVRRKECVLSLAAETMCPMFRAYWFHNWSGIRIKTLILASWIGFLYFFPVIFLMSNGNFLCNWLPR